MTLLVKPNRDTLISSVLLGVLLWFAFPASASHDDAVTLDDGQKNQAESQPNDFSYFQLIETAIDADPLLKSLGYQVRALQQHSIAAGQLPDPGIGLSVVNLPVNGFNLDSEAMTQIKLGVSQKIPRGDTLQLQSARYRQQAQLVRLQTRQRLLALEQAVGNHWLELYFAYTRKRYVEKSRSLFGKLIEVAHSQYSVGQKRLQDVLRAELEQTRLVLRISQIDGEIALLQAGFADWLPTDLISRLSAAQDLGNRLPALNIGQSWLELNDGEINLRLLSHPELQIAQQQRVLSDNHTTLVRQRYQPGYTLNASYGLRADDASGRSRADLFSVGIQLDLPLFSGNKQDRQVQAAILDSAAKTLDKTLLLKQMNAAFKRSKAHLLRLQQQLSLYQDQLLGQLHEQSETVLTAYTSDRGDFSAVMRAYIDELDGQLALSKINIEMLKQSNQMNYLFAQSSVRGALINE